MTFTSAHFLPEAVLARITDKRVSNPEFSFRAAQQRVCPEQLAADGRLAILAADHPARGIVKAGSDSLAMANRHDYLARIVRVLAANGVDGVMATMDVLEDLLAIDGLLRERGAPLLLDGKILIASLNRGGLAGSCWELDDPITGPSPETCRAWRLDGVKLLLRIARDDAGSLKTLQAAAAAISAANALRMPMFLEPLPVTRTDHGWTVTRTASALSTVAGIASALGDSSRSLWLKLPYCEDYQAVARSTTLPILLLGGESAGDPAPFLKQLGCAMAAGPNVRGALAGRNVLYPGSNDPMAVGAAVGGIVHEEWTVEAAMRSIAEDQGGAMDLLSRYFPGE
jgi:DhnA family fructose-bisphosphate aldolase class Ia